MNYNQEKYWSSKVRTFLYNTGRGYTPKGLAHFSSILCIIASATFSPERKESKFVELCLKEDWEMAFIYADTMNKEAFAINLFQNFNKWIKKTEEFIEFNRENRLGKILN